MTREQKTELMTFYHQRILDMRDKVYPNDQICRRVILAKQFIDLHFEMDLDLRAIAGRACFSRFHFIRLFKSLYGRTPHQYLISVRMEKAKQLLRAGHTVPQVCASIGFESTSSFRALFKCYTGESPAAYVKQLSVQQECKVALKLIPV